MKTAINVLVLALVLSGGAFAGSSEVCDVPLVFDVVPLRGGGTGGVSVSADNTWTGAQTFRDNKFSLTNASDPTKVLGFSLAGITTGNTRTITVPDASFTLAGLGLSNAFTGSNSFSQAILPSAVDTTPIGSASLPFTSAYYGESASLYGVSGWSKAETNHHLRIATDSTNRTVSLIDKANDAFNYAAVNASHPTLKIYSVNQNTSQWLGLYHDGTSSVIASGTSSYYFQASGNSPRFIGGNGDFSFGSDTTAVAIKFGRSGSALFYTGVANTGTNTGGNPVTFSSGIGTGTGATTVTISRNITGASGTTAQTQAPAVVVCSSKTLSNTTGTATAIANITLPSNSSGAARITVSVQCNDGTNFDSDIVTSYVAFVNKSTVVTVGTPVTTASAAANNSGSCTVAPSFVANGNSIDVKVTPVIGTITPTTTTAYVNIENLGAGVVACQ